MRSVLWTDVKFHFSYVSNWKNLQEIMHKAFHNPTTDYARLLIVNNYLNLWSTFSTMILDSIINYLNFFYTDSKTFNQKLD